MRYLFIFLFLFTLWKSICVIWCPMCAGWTNNNNKHLGCYSPKDKLQLNFISIHGRAFSYGRFSMFVQLCAGWLAARSFNSSFHTSQLAKVTITRKTNAKISEFERKRWRNRESSYSLLHCEHTTCITLMKTFPMSIYFIHFGVCVTNSLLGLTLALKKTNKQKTNSNCHFKSTPI